MTVGSTGERRPWRSFKCRKREMSPTKYLISTHEVSVERNVNGPRTSHSQKEYFIWRFVTYKILLTLFSTGYFRPLNRSLKYRVWNIGSETSVWNIGSETWGVILTHTPVGNRVNSHLKMHAIAFQRLDVKIYWESISPDPRKCSSPLAWNILRRL